MTSPHIIESRSEGILSLTISRPERRNSLTLDMYRALTDALLAAHADKETRVVLISGDQGFFTAGNDLSEFVGYQKGGEFIALNFLHAISSCRKPIAAAVERGAVGVGATLLQHCDFVYAGKSTRFSLPFINFGLCAEGGSTMLLGQGPLARQAARWLMLGDDFTAEEALQAGLITTVVNDDTALEAAQQVAARLAAMSPQALQITKAMLRRARGPVHEVMTEEIDHFTDLLEGDEAQALLRKFTTKAKA